MIKRAATILGLMLTTPALADDAGSLKALLARASHTAKPALVERYGPDDLRRGELRLPPGKGPFPLAILIHGGCWEAGIGGLIDMAPLATALTQRGFATWSIEYRRVGDAGGGYPGTFTDVGGGVDHVRALARRYPIDLSRAILIGHSAGAHLALWAASRPRLGDPIAGTDPLRPRAVVAIDGPGPLAPFVGVDAQICGHPVIVPLMGGTPAQKPAAYRLAQPADHLPLGLRQLLIEGELGGLMKPYAVAAKAAGDPVAILAPAGADHFDIVDPATPNGQAVVDFVVGRALK